MHGLFFVFGAFFPLIRHRKRTTRVSNGEACLAITASHHLNTRRELQKLASSAKSSMLWSGGVYLKCHVERALWMHLLEEAVFLARVDVHFEFVRHSEPLIEVRVAVSGSERKERGEHGDNIWLDASHGDRVYRQRRKRKSDGKRGEGERINNVIARERQSLWEDAPCTCTPKSASASKRHSATLSGGRLLRAARSSLANAWSAAIRTLCYAPFIRNPQRLQYSRRAI